MKKFVSILLALVMVLALGTTAFAATITVDGAQDGASYELYKIFDLEGKTTYTIPTNKLEAYKNSKVSIPATDGEGESTEYTFEQIFDVNGNYVTAKAIDSVILAWAEANTTLFDKVKDVTAQNGEAAFSDVAIGYYYVKSPVNQGAKVMIVNADDDATVVEKNTVAGWGDNGGKSAGDTVTVKFGDTVTYTLTYTNAVNYDNGEIVKTYKVLDEMPEGLELDTTSIKVSVNGTEKAIDVDYTSSSDKDNLALEIKWYDEDTTDFIYKKVPSTITIEYKVKVTDQANVGNNGIENSATIWPITENQTEPDPDDDTVTEKVWTGKITVKKYKTGDADKAELAGAEFVLRNDNEGENKNQYLKYDADGNVTWTTDITEAAKIVTGTTNSFEGLAAGNYTLIETKAPDGYKLPAANEAETSVTLSVSDDEKTVTMEDTKEIANSQAGSMPGTGGMGTTIFYLTGSILVLGACVLLVTRKRMSSVAE